MIVSGLSQLDLEYLVTAFSRAPVDWRDVPLLTALSLGVASVEADVSTDIEVGGPRISCLDQRPYI